MTTGIIRLEDIEVQFHENDYEIIPTPSKIEPEKLPKDVTPIRKESKNSDELSFSNPAAADDIYRIENREFVSENRTDENRNKLHLQPSGILSVSDDVLMVETALEYYNTCSSTAYLTELNQSTAIQRLSKWVITLKQKIRRLPSMLPKNNDKRLSSSMNEIPDVIIGVKSTQNLTRSSNNSLNGSGPSTSSSQDEQRESLVLPKIEPPFNATLVYIIILGVILFILVIGAVTTLIDRENLFKHPTNSTLLDDIDIVPINTGLQEDFAQPPVVALPQGTWVDSCQLQNIEPYSVAQLTKSFKATVADELTIERGIRVKAVYREDDWIYCETVDGRRGFVPQQYCKIKVHSAPSNAAISTREWQMIKTEGRGRKRENKAAGSATIKRGQTIAIAKRWEKTNLERFLESLPIQKEEGELFPRIPQGQTTVLYSYIAKRADDVNVESGDKVLILNKEDSDWTYCRNPQGEEGFVPAAHLECYNQTEMLKHKAEIAAQETTELLIIEDAAARSDVDLSVKQGDWVESHYPAANGWLWATDRHGKEGFIPSKIAIMATDL